MVSYRTNPEGMLEVFHEATGGYAPLMTLLQITGGLQTSLTSEQIGLVDSLVSELTEFKQLNLAKMTELLLKQDQLINGTLETSGVSVSRLVENCRLLIAGINQTLNTVSSKQDSIASYLYSNNNETSLIQETEKTFDELERLAVTVTQIKSRLDDHSTRLDNICQKTQADTLISVCNAIKLLLPSQSSPTIRNPVALVATASGIIPSNHVYCSIYVRTGQVTLNSTNISALVVPEGESFVNEQVFGESYGAINYSASGGEAVIYYKV